MTSVRGASVQPTVALPCCPVTTGATSAGPTKPRCARQRAAISWRDRSRRVELRRQALAQAPWRRELALTRTFVGVLARPLLEHVESLALLGAQLLPLRSGSQCDGV